jgi:hypothetical protein
MKIPYGQSDFADIRRRGMFYVDKTPALPELESDETGYRYLLFLRPRRFGKSLLLSMLGNYYDLARAGQFDELFGGLWIHEHPTPEQGRYLVLSLDFSSVNTSGGQETLVRTFFEVVRSGVEDVLIRYRERIPGLARLDDRLSTYQDADALMLAFLRLVGALGHKAYVLIDEYDHFANRLLSDGEDELYESIVRGTGFVRSFYAALKTGTGTGGLARMFVTGISPVMLDDLSSGFNIITHISQLPRFNTMAGFTRADVERAVDETLATSPRLEDDPRLGDRARLLETLERYYNGYRFSEDATESMYNSDLVLYFLLQIQSTGRYPKQMLDMNVRTDYGRLQRIATISGAVGATTRALLESILMEDHIESRIVEQFGLQTMHRPEQLVSLFYYMGMLTFLPQPAGTVLPRLCIPNRVIRELQWEYLAIAMSQGQGLWIDTRSLEKALEDMAVKGDIEPLLSLFREQVMDRIGVKDQRQFNEGTLKLMLVAYITQSRAFHILSEKEFARGYCDLFLALTEEVSAGQYAWMLEVKYLKTHAKQAEIDKVIAGAYEQLERYASDTTLVPLLTRGKHLKAGALIFVGGKDVLFRPWPPPAGAAKKAAPRAKRKPATRG